MKKLNKLVAILVAMAMMATLCVISAFAAPYAEGKGPLSLSKTLTMPQGTTTPTTNFTFTFTQETTGQPKAVSIPNVVLPFSAEDTGATEDGVKTVTKTWMDVLKNVTFDKPGLYVYTVKETAGAATVDESGKYTGHYDYSQAEYKISILVDNQGNVTDVVAQQTKDDEGGTDDITGDGKVTPTPPTGQEDKIPTEEPDNIGDKTDVSADGYVNFTNNYYRTVDNTPTGTDNDPDGEDPDSLGDKDGDSLYVEKYIQVSDPKYIETDRTFDFTITVAFPANTDTATYTAVVVNAAGNEYTGEDAQTLTFTRANAESLEQEFTLRHGDRLVFTAIDIGATYSVTEATLAETDDYTYSTGNVSNERVVDSADNGTKVVNVYDYSTTTPTGILINNLPYIALALVAIGGLVAYIVVRRRNADEA